MSNNPWQFRLKPDDIGSARSEYQYQAAFDTVADTWTRIHLPFESFVSVKRNDVDYSAPKVVATFVLTLTDFYLQSAARRCYTGEQGSGWRSHAVPGLGAVSVRLQRAAQQQVPARALPTGRGRGGPVPLSSTLRGARLVCRRGEDQSPRLVPGATGQRCAHRAAQPAGHLELEVQRRAGPEELRSALLHHSSHRAGHSAPRQ